MPRWSTRIKQAMERGYFTQQDRDDAESWLSCSVGERHDGVMPSPLDEPELFGLGVRFGHLVSWSTRKPGDGFWKGAELKEMLRELELPAAKRARIEEAAVVNREIMKLTRP